MKKILLISLLLCSFFYQSNAQVNIGLKAGIGLSRLNYRPSKYGLEVDEDKTFMCVPSAYAIVSFPVGNAFIIRSGVGFYQQAFSYTTSTQRITARLSYFDIPLAISYKLPFLQRKLDIFAGGSFGINLGGNAELKNIRYNAPRRSLDVVAEDGYGGYNGYGNGYDSDKLYSNPYNLSLLFGANYQLSKNILLGVEARCGLSNVMPHDYSRYNYVPFPRTCVAKTQTYTFSVAYVLGLGKKKD